MREEKLQRYHKATKLLRGMLVLPSNQSRAS